MNSINKTYKNGIIPFYLLTVLFSWTLFFITDAWLIPKYSKAGFVIVIALFGHIAAMLFPMLMSMVVLKYFQKKKLIEWKRTNKKYYLYVFLICLLIWLPPALLYLIFTKSIIFKTAFTNFDFIFIISYLVLGWVAGMGEEYGWSGYILSELSGKIGKSKAVVVSGCLRGLWHLPLLVIPILLKVISGDKSIIELFLFAIIFSVQLAVSNVFFSALFGYAWYKTNSIPLIGLMHFLFDALRDFSAFFIIGFTGSFWFKFGWGVPFLILAYFAFTKIAMEEGYSNYLEIFYKKKLNS